MPAIKDWRSASTADDFAGLDYADFAQEFLRRNPDYCAEYHALAQRIGLERLDWSSEMEALAQRWGLSFPLRPGPCARAGPGDLGAAPEPWRRRPRRRTR